MDITWHGHANYTLKGAGATLVVDPFADIGLKQPKLAADVLLISHDHFDHNNTEGVSGDPYIVDLPGEYESHGVMIEGILTYHDAKKGADRGANIVFSFTMDGIHLVHCGDLGHRLDDEVVERLGNIDILFVPVGGFYTIDGKTAVDVVKRLQPRVTVPMHYLAAGLSGAAAKIGPIDDFLKEAGGTPVNLEKPTWKIKKSELPEEESQIVIFLDPA